MKSAKFSWWNYTLWPVLKILLEPIGKKSSHFWHWQPYFGPTFTGLSITGDHTAKDRKTWWRNFSQSNFGWKEIFYVEPELFEGHSAFDGEYHVGFHNQDKNQNEICWLKLKGRVALLRGNQMTEYFAVSADGHKPLLLKLVGMGRKSNLEQGIVLI